MLFHGLAALTSSPVLAFNLLLITSVLAAGLSVYTLLRLQGLEAWEALIGAGAFSLSGWVVGALAEGQLSAFSLWALPLILVAWVHWEQHPGVLPAISVAGAFALLVFSDVRQIEAGLLLLLPYAIVRLWHWDKALRIDHADELRLLALLLLIILLIFPAPNIMRVAAGAEPAYGVLGLPQDSLSTFGLLRMLAGTILLFGLLFWYGSSTGEEAWLWLGVAALCMAIAMGMLATPLSLLMASLNGEGRSLASSSAFGGAALLALVQAAAVVWRSRRPQHFPIWALPGAALAILAISIGANPALIRGLPHSIPPASDFYQELRAEPEDYYLLQYPYGLVSSGSGEQVGTSAELAATVVWHGKRSLTAVAPYVSSNLLSYFRGLGFTEPDQLSIETAEAAAQALDEAVMTWRIAYVVIHPELLTPEEQVGLDLLLAKATSLCPPQSVEGLSVYRALWHPAACETIFPEG